MTDDPGVIWLRNQIIRVFNSSNPRPPLSEALDLLIAEYTDGIIDREAARWKATIEAAKRQTHHDVDQFYKE